VHTIALNVARDFFVADIQPQPRRISDVFHATTWMSVIEIDKCARYSICEHAIAGTRVAMTYDLRSTLSLEIRRGIMQ
jgi:hypothetical protein